MEQPYTLPLWWGQGSAPELQGIPQHTLQFSNKLALALVWILLTSLLCLTSLQTLYPAFLKSSLLMLAFLLSFQLALFNSFLGTSLFNSFLPTPPLSWCSCCWDVAQLCKWAQGQCYCPSFCSATALPSFFGIVMSSHGLWAPRYQDSHLFF